tara:strand:- start:13574 stop:17470 length:3897 start_codon:yes stop_codon:yes gene_type:complete
MQKDFMDILQGGSTSSSPSFSMPTSPMQDDEDTKDFMSILDSAPVVDRAEVEVQAITDIPEAVPEVEEEPELTQEELQFYYQSEYADLFDEDGQLTDVPRAVELGIIDDPDNPGYKVQKDGGIIPTPPTRQIIFNDIGKRMDAERSNMLTQMSRLERSKFEREESRKTILEAAEEKGMAEDDFIEQVLIPSIDPEESPYLRKFFDYTGASGFNILNSVGTGLDVTAGGFKDAMQAIAETMQDNMPDVYDAMNVALVGAKQTPEQFAESAGDEAFNFLTFVDTIPAMGIIARPLAGATKAQKESIKATEQLNKAIEVQKKATTKEAKAIAGKKVKAARENLDAAVAKEMADRDARDIKAQIKADKKWNRKLNVNKARNMTAIEETERAAEAARVAEGNRDIAEDMIRAFEDETGEIISLTDDAGRLRIDPDKARAVGQKKTEDILSAERKGMTGGADVTVNDLAALATGKDSLVVGIVDPAKFDGIVAAAADLKKANPDAFKPRVWEYGPRKGKEYTVIDNLFDLTVNKDLLAGDELLDMLNKYGVSYEDYVLAIVGSGSTAGKVLNKLSQIKRARPGNELDAAKEAATAQAQTAIRKTVMRIENIRRGGMVSQLATAARNLTSAGIRAPLEGIGNVMDNALWSLSNEGILAAGKQLNPLSAGFKDSFRSLRYMFGPEYATATREYVDFILQQPEIAKQADLLFNNINEIQRLTGRGEAKTAFGKYVLDPVLSTAEDGVMFLNGPNRWQEHLIRRGAFFGELERLVRREYKVDFIEALNNGKIRDFMNDASSVRPEGARSFINIVEEATQKALDITYAKQPDVLLFRNWSQFIVRNGLTVVLPFPRFMFNSLELMGQYMGGASLPLSRKLASIVTKGRMGKGKLSMKDRQRISRNLVGMGASAPLLPAAIGAALDDDAANQEQIGDDLLSIGIFGAAYQYRMMPDAPADYKFMTADDGNVIDTTTQYPMRQFLYIGEATKRLQEGTFDEFFDSKEFNETFLGTNIRTGVGAGISREILDIVAGSDITLAERGAKGFGRLIGNYLSSWAVPFAQIIEAQRATGGRGLEYKDVAEDPTLNAWSSFKHEINRPFKQRGFTISPEEEAKLPPREFLFKEDAKRVYPFARVIGGLSFSEADSAEGEYIKKLGLSEFMLGSNSRVPSIRRFENQVLREAIPEIVSAARTQEKKYRTQYKFARDAVKKKYTEEEFVLQNVKPLITKQIGKIKRDITEQKKLSAKAPAYTSALIKFRRLPPDIRTQAISQFVLQKNKEPDVANINDFEDLESLHKIGKVLLRKQGGR